ncbi:MAG: hypothetical protein NPIRA01_12160 [Nitrospirales bacterium]|nr:MAG: hypothetical protein NPIRA01_12160 [Nitrospirales bacterium]
MHAPEERDGMKQNMLSVNDQIEDEKGKKSISPYWQYQMVEETPAFGFNVNSRSDSPGHEKDTQNEDIDDGHRQIVHPAC